jgi:hypothetical protein
MSDGRYERQKEYGLFVDDLTGAEDHAARCARKVAALEHSRRFDGAMVEDQLAAAEREEKEARARVRAFQGKVESLRLALYPGTVGPQRGE